MWKTERYRHIRRILVESATLTTLKPPTLLKRCVWITIPSNSPSNPSNTNSQSQTMNKMNKTNPPTKKRHNGNRTLPVFPVSNLPWLGWLGPSPFPEAVRQRWMMTALVSLLDEEGMAMVSGFVAYLESTDNERVEEEDVSICMYIYIYTYIYMYMYIYILSSRNKQNGT